MAIPACYSWSEARVDAKAITPMRSPVFGGIAHAPLHRVRTNSHRREKRIAATIDHTLLKPEATAEDIEKVCLEAVQIQLRFGLRESLLGSARGHDTRRFSGEGLHRDRLSVGGQSTGNQACRSDSWRLVKVRTNWIWFRMSALFGRATIPGRAGDRESGRIGPSPRRNLKVILETSLLTTEQKVQACQIAVEANADFVKRPLAFSSAGATAADVNLMRLTVGPDAGRQGIRRNTHAGSCL